MDIEKTKSWISKCLETEKSKFPSENLEEDDIKELTYDFLDDLRSIFEHYVQAYEKVKIEKAENSVSETLKEKLKTSFFIYDLAGAKGFMLFKKNYKMVFSYVKPGQIRIKFLKQKLFSELEVFVDTYVNAVSHESMSIRWIHDDKKGFVDKNILARYYMKRFLEEI